MTPDLSADGPMLLGTVGWRRRDWLGYYPADLPPEWRLAYLGNDCDCVLLSARDWYTVDEDASDHLTQAIEEAPEGLVFLLETDSGKALPEVAWARFAGHPVVLLGDRPSGVPGDWASCPTDGRGAWVATDGARIQVWSVAGFDLRALRERALALPPATRLLLLDGPAASPARVPELRTLMQLLGIA